MKHLSFARLLVPWIFLYPLNVYADDVSKGRDAFLSLCIACHAFSCNRETHEANSPKLSGLFGRKAGSVEDFTGYSEGFKNSEVIWDDETLEEFFENPSFVASESTAGPEWHRVGASDVRRQLIAYLKTEDQSVDVFCK